ncbi:MAG: membrane protein insertase YidC [Victivallales bacterium]
MQNKKGVPMKLDKETIIALCVCFALLIFWEPIMRNLIGSPKPPQKTVVSGTGKQANTPPGDSSLPSPAGPEARKTDDAKKETVKSTEPVKTGEAKKTATLEKTDKVEEQAELPETPVQVISNDCISMAINPSNGSVTSIEFKKYPDASRKKMIVLNEDFDPGALSFTTADKLRTTGIECTKESENCLRLTRGFKNESGQPFNIVQTWKIEGKYTTGYSIDIKNLSGESLILNGIHVSAGSMIPILELSGDNFIMENHFISSCLDATVASKAATTDKPFEVHQENAAKWIAVSNKYFSCILKPETSFIKGDGNMLRQIIKTIKDQSGKEKTYSSLETYGIIEKTEIAPGAKASIKFTYFSGPKELALLKDFDPKASEIMNLCYTGNSWFLQWYSWFEPISHGLLIALIWLKGFCGNYGLSIILLTVIVKMLFWPITDRANASMRKMQKIQPLVQEIRTKYKEDAQKMNTKIMQLYKEHKVNPLGGCLPILLQIPIFMALYSALNGAIELRQSSFLWAADLSQPDTIGMIPGLDLPINPLVLVMTVTMVVQQYLTPSAMDPVQQKMMMILPLVMLVMLYSLPSGLTLYWSVSQIISIIQLLVNKKLDKNEKSLEKKTA